MHPVNEIPAKTPAKRPHSDTIDVDVEEPVTFNEQSKTVR
jgi:hypothetical protein